MPPEADVEICALDGSGIILSFILSKNDMMGESVSGERLLVSRTEECRYRWGRVEVEGMLRVTARSSEFMSREEAVSGVREEPE